MEKSKDLVGDYCYNEDFRLTDSGEYSCRPSNALPDSVTIHVLTGLNNSPFYYNSIWYLYFSFFKQLPNTRQRL